MNTVVETKRKIVIGIPGNSFTSKFLISWTSTLNALWESGKYDIVISPGVSSFVTFARMQTLGLDVLKGIDVLEELDLENLEDKDVQIKIIKTEIN